MRTGHFLAVWLTMATTSTANDFVPHPIFTMKLDGSELREVASPPGRTCGSPQWSPDGKSIVFDTVIPPFQDIQVHVVQLATGVSTVVGAGAFPTWSPDGELIALMRTRPNNEYGVWMMQPDGGDSIHLFDEGTYPRWSPDGDWISYRARTGGLAMYRLTTGEHRAVYQDQTEPLRWGRSWSPDGMQLAVAREYGQKDLEIKLLSPAKSHEAWAVGPALFRGSLSSHINWSPDGKHVLIGVYFPGDGPRHLYVLDVDGETPPQLIPNQDMKYNYCDGSWSPDGKYITFMRAPH